MLFLQVFLNYKNRKKQAKDPKMKIIVFSLAKGGSEALILLGGKGTL
jgi:hypothetical protein